MRSLVIPSRCFARILLLLPAITLLSASAVLAQEQDEFDPPPPVPAPPPAPMPQPMLEEPEPAIPDQPSQVGLPQPVLEEEAEPKKPNSKDVSQAIRRPAREVPGIRRPARETPEIRRPSKKIPGLGQSRWDDVYILRPYRPGKDLRGPRSTDRVRDLADQPRSEIIEIDGVAIRRVGGRNTPPMVVPAPPAPPASQIPEADRYARGPGGVVFDRETNAFSTPNATFDLSSGRVEVFSRQPNGVVSQRPVTYNKLTGAFSGSGVSYDPRSGIFRDRRNNVTFNTKTGDLKVIKRNPYTDIYYPVTTNLYNRNR